MNAPAEPGYYWVRLDRGDGHPRDWRPCEVTPDATVLVLWYDWTWEIDDPRIVEWGPRLANAPA